MGVIKGDTRSLGNGLYRAYSHHPKPIISLSYVAQRVLGPLGIAATLGPTL